MFRNSAVSIAMLLTLAACASQQEETPGIPWWFWLIGILILVVLLWLIFRTRPETEHRPHQTAGETINTTDEQIVEPVTSAPIQSEDFKIIEGIGPKINAILHAAGVHTYEQMAEMKPEEIKEILTRNDIQLGDPTTWPDQARMAANGEMDKLKEYQDRLQGGRTV